MPAIGLRAFHEMFGQARSMALVGNADTILEHASGDRIDGCDLVVRFNRAHVVQVRAESNGQPERTPATPPRCRPARSMARRP